ncbi:MAG: hypothetical protein AAF628_00370 [Planctomycetota bacterium]
MMKLLKLALIGSLGAGAAGYFFLGDGALTYVSTMARSVKESVRGQIPIEFELKRAESLIRDIRPQMHQCKRDVALADVRLRQLIDEVENLEIQVATAERTLKTGADALGGANVQALHALASGRYSRERLEVGLERTFDNFKANNALLKSKQALIERRQRELDAARAKVDAVRTEEARLKELIGQLKTQKALVDAMKASSKNVELDDSALGEAKKVLAEVKERLDVAQRMLEDEMSFDGGRDRRPQRDIVGEINDHFSGGVLSAPKTEAVFAR